MSTSTITVGNNDGEGINSFGDLFKGVYLVYMVVGLSVIAVLALMNVLFRYLRSKAPNYARTRRGHDGDQTRRNNRGERRLLATILNSLTRNITRMSMTRGGGTTVQESKCATSPVNSPPMSPVQDDVRMESRIPNPIPPGVVQSTVSISRDNMESTANLV